MIAFKRIVLISIVLLTLAIAFIVWGGLWYAPRSTDEITKTYGKNKVTFTSDDFSEGDSRAVTAKITLSTDKITTSNRNVSVTGNTVSIYKGGIYEISGTLDGGNIRISSQDGKGVQLILNGAHITSHDSAAILVDECVKTIITAKKGTQNSLSDNALRTDEESAVIYCRDDLTVNGGGKLTVNALFADGIKCNDSLRIVGSDIVIDATDEGINANNSVAVLSSALSISSGGDGIKCEDSEESRGFAALEDATITLTSRSDGIWAKEEIYITGGDYVISCQNGDAIHAEQDVVINPQTLAVNDCYEGIEGKTVTIDGGDIKINSRDDAINAVGSEQGGRTRPMGLVGDVTKDNTYLVINGGNIVLNTSGDGIDSNGAAVINGGSIKVFGPENGGNSSLDFEYGFVINGGTLLAAGNSSMAESPHESSTNNSLVFYLDKVQTGDIMLENSAGNTLSSGNSKKLFDWVCISSPDITTGNEYTLKINGVTAATLACTSKITANRERGGFMRR